MTLLGLIPIEIIDAIIPYLWEEVPEPPPLGSWEVEKKPPSRGLASYATISQKWRFAIERYTFASLVTFSDDLFRLKQIVGNCPRRRSHVKELWFSIDLPLYSDSRRNYLERPEEHKANLAVFQQGVQDIWEELLRWNEECPASGMKLVLNADAPVDRGRETSKYCGIGGPRERWERVQHFLSLDQPRLPPLPSISELGISFTGRQFHPSAIESLILSLPALRQLHLFIGAPKPINHELRAEHRAILARALHSPTLHKLEFLSIRMWYDTPNNHSWDMSPAHDLSYPQGDVLNRAICKLAQRSLRYLNLIGAYPISPALWGEGEERNDTSSTKIIFPYLQKVYIMHSHITYDGRWLYTGHPVTPPPDHGQEPISRPPIVAEHDHDWDALELESAISITRDRLENGDYPSHEWRVWPDPETFYPLIRSLGRAVLRMPKLKSLRVELYTRTFLDNRIMMQIAAPGEKAGVLHWTRRVEDNLGQWRWIVLLESDLEDWKFPADIPQLMKNKVGNDGVVIIQQFP
ncbi:hypothetical protein BDV12DRAFT_196848 [Aspergillus spectabilis]